MLVFSPAIRFGKVQLQRGCRRGRPGQGGTLTLEGTKRNTAACYSGTKTTKCSTFRQSLLYSHLVFRILRSILLVNVCSFSFYRFLSFFFLFLLFAPYADAIRGDAFNPRVAQCERQLCLLFTVMGNNHNSTLPLPHSRTSFVELAAPQRISQLNFGKYKQQQQ